MSCSRRALLRGAGLVLVGGVIGCRTSLDQQAVDAAAPPPDGPMRYTTCGTNICLDLNDTQNQALKTAGGNIRFEAPNGDTIIVIRVDATTVDTLSDVCTHAGCEVNFRSTLGHLLCPCHGSQFALDGTVLVGPAIKPLHAYPTTFDAATNTVTITIA
jgi:cytochrome b6-f complex iron-sulfur subunit